jgi:hypothetical protein
LQGIPFQSSAPFSGSVSVLYPTVYPFLTWRQVQIARDGARPISGSVPAYRMHACNGRMCVDHLKDGHSNTDGVPRLALSEHGDFLREGGRCQPRRGKHVPPATHLDVRYASIPHIFGLLFCHVCSFQFFSFFVSSVSVCSRTTVGAAVSILMKGRPARS